jgi:allantoicase
MSTGFTHLIDLASERMGGIALYANDEFFAPKEHLLLDSAPEYREDAYTDHGKWMDGWETRRRREPGEDFCLIRLGARGVVHGVVVDTTHFRGNYPERCKIEGCSLSGTPSVATLLDPSTPWITLVPETQLEGDCQNEIPVRCDVVVTHIRFTIIPDGGVARLRVHGEATADWSRLDAFRGPVDLAAARHGGRAIAQSDMFFGPSQNLLMPGPARHMGEGWETRRRRDDGHDWVVIQLGRAGVIQAVEVDTSHFKGNCPARCQLELAHVEHPPADPSQWEEIPFQQVLDERLQPDTRQLFEDELMLADPATHARIRIFPDGGIARLRIYGRTERANELALKLMRFNVQDEAKAIAALRACCDSDEWARRTAAARPFADLAMLRKAADKVWWELGEAGWLKAFEAHPRIGDRTGSAWSRGEQSRVADASDAIRQQLVEENERYEQKFGFVFLICATGKAAEEMLATLRARMHNHRATEIRVAAEEQRKITHLRIDKLLLEIGES